MLMAVVVIENLTNTKITNKMNTLFICVTCQRIIGCGTASGKMDKQCTFCHDFDQCVDETPIGKAVLRTVIFVHFENGCFDHSRIPIGFKLTKKGDSK